MFSGGNKRTTVFLILLCLAIGIGIAEAQLLRSGNSLPSTTTTTAVTISYSNETKQRVSPFGELSLTVKVVSYNEVVLNLTFINHEVNPSERLYMMIAVWGSNETRRTTDYGILPGFDIVSGNMEWNGPAEVQGVSIEARVRFIKDGKYMVSGSCYRRHESNNPSEIIFMYLRPVVINVSNGRVTDITLQENTGYCG